MNIHKQSELKLGTALLQAMFMLNGRFISYKINNVLQCVSHIDGMVIFQVRFLNIYRPITLRVDIGEAWIHIVLSRHIHYIQYILSKVLFVCGISLTSGQLINELFPDCTRSCFSQVVIRRRGGDRIYEMRCLVKSTI